MTSIAQVFQQAVQFHQQGNFAQADQLYRQVLQADPNNFNALHLFGVLACQGGRPDVGVDLMQKAVRLKPDFAEAHGNLGNAYRQLGRQVEAIASFRRSVAYKPGFAESHHGLGMALVAQRNVAEALTHLREAVRLRPNYAEAFFNLGNLLREQGQLDEAVLHLQQAVLQAPNHAPAHGSLGVALFERGNLPESLACLQEALRLAPNLAEAHLGLANVLKEQDKTDEALAHVQRALALKPDLAECHNSLGNLLADQGKSQEASACWSRALQLKPGYAEPHLGIGVQLLREGKPAEAAARFAQAVAIEPKHATAHTNHGISMLLMGKLKEGWQEYEWRWNSKEMPRRQFQQPLWDGSSLAGRTILLHTEQGLGDNIQFIRYVPLVKKRGGTVILETHEILAPILSTCAGIDRIVMKGNMLPAFDVHVPLMSLPGIFGTTLESIPADVPYLKPDEKLMAHWQAEFHDARTFNIGINWMGSIRTAFERTRSLPLELFENLARLPNVRLYSLQKGHGNEQLRGLASPLPIIDLANRLDNGTGAFVDTAALMKSLDLVISSDTSIAHLAGALAIPVWMPLPFAADWRWLQDREDCPWYPTMRIFRQKEPGGWQDVFARMTHALTMRIAHQPRAQATGLA